MGFDDGQIILDSDNGVYFAGQTIYGRMVFDQRKPKNIHGIYIYFKGFCKVHWTTTRRRRVGNGYTTDTIHHESYEEYFNRTIFVFGNEDGDHQLEPGHYEFKFDFPLPTTIPSSFEAFYGHIRYRVKAVMLTSGMLSSNKQKRAGFRVFSPVDLNLLPYSKKPLQVELTNSYSCWCAAAGSSEVRVKMPLSGYCPGQTIPLEVKVSNLSRVDIDEIKMTIIREIRFEAVSRPGVRTDTYKVAQIKKGPVPGGTAPEWNLEMPIPAMEVYNFDACKYIYLNYSFKLSIKVGACHNDAEETYPIVFGNIPLVGFQDNLPNPLQDQMPKNIPGQNTQGVNYYPAPAIINQPQASKAQSDGNQQNTPGPQPYPGTQPFPNQPYPNVTPYSMPIPCSSGPPYPAENLPQPAPAPYPAPEPVTKPAVTNSHFLKTGNIGFVVSGDGASAPLLAPGSNAPYPTGPPSSPNGAPSAPKL